MQDVPSRRPQLLVIDDEPDVLDLLVEFAGRAGYDVTATSAPDEFDSLYHDGFDVIVLDLWMPGIDGIELIRRLAERRSQARLVLVSGFDERVLDLARQLATSHGLQVAGSLTKPVRLSQLTAMLDGYRTETPVATGHVFEVTVAELQRALAEDWLTVHYQPQVSLRTGEVIGVEALVRWEHPEGHPIPPAMFIQVAEATGLSEQLTWRVIEKTAEDVAVLPVSEKFRVGINLPPAALTDVSFPDRLVDRLRDTALTPKVLHFEITETSVAHESVAALDILTRLRLKGFSLSIDDFGTGYSSFERLQRLPLSSLKIDKSFVRRMDIDAGSRAIVENCVGLGHDLKLTVVAEGAETLEVWDLLAAVGCDVVQGFFVRRPCPAQELAAWLTSWSGPRVAR